MDEGRKKSKTKVKNATNFAPINTSEVYNYCLSGATSKTLIIFPGVHSTTEKKVLRIMCERSVKKGKDLSDVKITGSMFKRVIDDTYQQAVAESLKVKPMQRYHEKVTNVLGTFLTKDLEKVTNMVGTFLAETKFELLHDCHDN